MDESMHFEVTEQITGQLTRRQVRNLLLRKRLGYAMDHRDSAMAEAIWDIIRTRLKGVYTLDQFTHMWDIAPKDPLKPIVELQWDDLGGGYDKMTGAYDPPAFTKQD